MNELESRDFLPAEERNVVEFSKTLETLYNQPSFTEAKKNVKINYLKDRSVTNDCKYLNIIYLNCRLIVNEYESDLHHNKHYQYLSSGDDKACKKIQRCTGVELTTSAIPVLHQLS